MKDKKLKDALKSQHIKQIGEASTRYFELAKETIGLIERYRLFIADLHLQQLEKGFDGIDQLIAALNAMEEAQKAARYRCFELGLNLE